jgi:hypothetical protein
MSFDYARDIFGLTFITHCFPKILHPVIFLLAPARWRLGKYSKAAHAVLAPAVKQWEEAKAVGALDGEEFTLLGGMLKDAKGSERNMEEIVLRQMIASLASIHTSVMTSTYCLMEICRHPEYMEPLLEEARECMSKDQDWARHSTERLPMMDSFICEVHRLHPPSVRKNSLILLFIFISFVSLEIPSTFRSVLMLILRSYPPTQGQSSLHAQQRHTRPGRNAIWLPPRPHPTRCLQVP